MKRIRALDRINLRPTDRIPHWEHFSNPDFEEWVTGVDPWKHPRLARQRLLELLPMDVGDVRMTEEPAERPPGGGGGGGGGDGGYDAGPTGAFSRWGTGRTWRWDWGKGFAGIDDVLAYDPLAQMDLREAGLVADHDYSLGVDDLAVELQKDLDESRAATGERALVIPGHYNTLFMWPLLTFGWELFLELGALHPAETARLLDGFAELSRRIFMAWARTDVEVITSHDDICHRAGPVFGPRWLARFIYPFYEEFWSYLRSAGKKVVFISDGKVDAVADDIFACGADGIASESYTNWEEIASKHPDKVLLGDGDNRVIATGDRDAIEAMVRKMASLGRRVPGYFFCTGNHLPWDLSADSIQLYFDASEKYGTG